MYMSTQNRCSPATFLIETESRNTQANSKQNIGVMASDGPSSPFPFLAPWPFRPPAIETPPRPVPAGPPISWPKNALCSWLPPLTLPLHCVSILQPATLSQVVASKSETISVSIRLNRFTLAESRKSDLWTCMCVFTLSSAFAFLIEMNISCKSLFAIWSLSPQRFHYFF